MLIHACVQVSWRACAAAVERSLTVADLSQPDRILRYYLHPVFLRREYARPTINASRVALIMHNESFAEIDSKQLAQHQGGWKAVKKLHWTPNMMTFVGAMLLALIISLAFVALVRGHGGGAFAFIFLTIIGTGLFTAGLLLHHEARQEQQTEKALPVK